MFFLHIPKHSIELSPEMSCQKATFRHHDENGPRAGKEKVQKKNDPGYEMWKTDVVGRWKTEKVGNNLLIDFLASGSHSEASRIPSLSANSV